MSLELDEETLDELGWGEAIDHREVGHKFDARSGNHGLVSDRPKADRTAKRKAAGYFDRRNLRRRVAYRAAKLAKEAEKEAARVEAQRKVDARYYAGERYREAHRRAALKYYHRNKTRPGVSVRGSQNAAQSPERHRPAMFDPQTSNHEGTP